MSKDISPEEDRAWLLEEIRKVRSSLETIAGLCDAGMHAAPERIKPIVSKTRGAMHVIDSVLRVAAQTRPRAETPLPEPPSEAECRSAAEGFANGVIGGPERPRHVRHLARILQDWWREGARAARGGR